MPHADFKILYGPKRGDCGWKNKNKKLCSDAGTVLANWKQTELIIKT